MDDHNSPPEHVQPHLDAIKDHVEELKKFLPPESLKNLTVQLTHDHQMLICYPDPNNPGKLICT